MKKIFCIFLLGITCAANAQNLVPNSSFEDKIACPTGFDELPFISDPTVSITGWTKPSEASSDYFNTCATGGSPNAVPVNFAGTQVPRTGNAYSGGYVMAGAFSDYREYLQAHLSSPLIAGHHYHVSYWISLAEWNSPGTGVMAVDRMGAYVGVLPEERMGITTPMTDLVPQVESPPGLIFTDTLGWTNISGIFTAAGSEEWLILGNFQPNDSITTQVVSPNAFSTLSYYYYDDVCLLDLDGAPVSFTTHDTVLCNSASMVISGRDGAMNYLWDDGSTARDRTITEGGSYWVKSIDPANCTILADSFNVGTRTVQPLDIGKDTIICPNASIIIDAFDPEYTEYQWSTGATTPSITVTKGGTYYVTISSDCFLATDTIVIMQPPVPLAQLPRDTVLCKGIKLDLRNIQENVQYSWNTGAKGCCIVVDSPGTYSLTVSNICNESSTDEINIEYSGCSDCVLTPTAFSPNGDGLNDKYTPLVNCTMKSYVLKIFNRWGQIVFESYTPGEGWDGRTNGHPAEAGVYFFYLRATPVIDRVEKTEQKGDITLLR